MIVRGRASAVLAVTALIGTALAGCAQTQTGTPAPAAPAIRTVASAVMPFQPANSVWYSAAVLKAERPFARWEQDRDRIELVTWPQDCARVPVAISFVPGDSTIDVELGRAPCSEGPRQCAADQVLTSTFLASRALRRDRSTTILLDGRRVVLPKAPTMVTEPVPMTVTGFGRPHPLRQLNSPLPQYSVRDSPWGLIAPASPASTTIAIGWIGGTCQRNASVAYVVETASTVTIDTALAPPPLRPHPARPRAAFDCAGVGIGLAASIRLQQPLGTRTLLQHQYGVRPADQNAY